MRFDHVGAGFGVTVSRGGSPFGESPARQAGPTVNLFCRKGLSPDGEPSAHIAHVAGRRCCVACTQVAASCEVLLGKEDLPKSASAPELSIYRCQAVSWVLVHQCDTHRTARAVTL